MTVLLAVLTVVACRDAAGPSSPGPGITIVPVEASVFEGDSVRLAATVFDEAGAVDPAAPVTWTVSDTTLAVFAGGDILALLRPGTVRITARSGAAAATYDLAIGRLVVERVELSPESIGMGRTDHLTVTARVLGQGNREIKGRPVSFTSDDTLVAIVWETASMGNGLLVAVGGGATTIRASVDGVTGTAHVGVVLVDTTFVLTRYDGSSVPVLVEADTLLSDGAQEIYEIYVSPGTLVLSGLLQKRYELDVHYSVFEVITTGDTVERQLRFVLRYQFDRGLVTAGANGSLSMLSEIIGPHLEHTAAPRSDGYLVHYRIPGESSFLDFGFTRVTP